MQPVEILYLSDRMHVSHSDIPAGVTEVLKEHGMVDLESGRIYFCGLLRVGCRFIVFLPRNHTGSPEPADRSAYYLLRALVKFYRTRESGMRANDYGTMVTGGESLSLAVALIEDYLVSGLYVRRARVRTINNGKTSWPRTIARNTAYPSAGGQVYLDLATTRTHYSTDCMTARIHASVMREVLASYGMLWLGKSSVVDRKLAAMPAPVGTPDAWIRFLSKELQLSYSERDIFLIRSLIAYLKKEKGTIQGPLLVGVKKFHGLWEAMLDECLVGKLRVNDRLPVPAYLTADGKIELIAGKGQRTDTVLQDRGSQHIAVIDAKYYDAHSPRSAPGWPDLVKQFFYQQTIEHLCPSKHISNHFIFPGNEEKNLKSAFVVERDSKKDCATACLPRYGPIHCHYQDPLALLRLYATGEKLTALTKEIFDTGAVISSDMSPRVSAV
ncbi:LlaJI family restriction endonuclease [Plesiomonas shigelloides]|uniref:LlaJI family restriction endonuclease n=1 Tax=Plesiomonas shigelloides TaxID=703 RepID=UPI00387F2E35